MVQVALGPDAAGERVRAESFSVVSRHGLHARVYGYFTPFEIGRHIATHV